MPIEDCDRCEGARQMWVLLEAPHQALCIAHLAIELRGVGHGVTLRHDGQTILTSAVNVTSSKP